MCRDVAKPASSEKVQVYLGKGNDDLTATRQEHFLPIPAAVERAASKMLKDQRDMHMVRLFVNLCCTVVPASFALLVLFTPLGRHYVPLPAWLLHLAGVAYVAFWLLVCLERFLLCLHFFSHRLIFKAEHDVFHKAVWYFLTPFFGLPGAAYRLHHVIMHHTENNHAPLDTTATETYQRDSLVQFLGYWARFVFLTPLEVPLYALYTNRLSWLGYALFHETLWIGTLYLLATQVSFWGTFYPWLATHVVAMTAMSFGNWSQHIFVDPDQPMENARLTYNCISHFGNQRTFNDGYHLIHHKNPRLHWSELPTHFEEHKQAMAADGGWTFKSIHFFDLGILVMTGQLEKLARDHFVFVPPAGLTEAQAQEAAPTVEEVVAMFRHRLRPASPEALHAMQAAAPVGEPDKAMLSGSDSCSKSHAKAGKQQ